MPLSAKTTRALREQAWALQSDALLWDMTLPWEPNLWPKEGVLERFRCAGFDCVSLTMVVDRSDLEEAVHHIADESARIRAEPERFRLVRGVDDVLAAKKDGQLALILHFQGTNALEGRLEHVELFYDLGVRHWLLAYNQKNRVGDGCHERTDGGLSRFGVELIAEMNRVGVLLDGSHSGYRTTMEAMELSTAPCVFTHSGCRAVHEHERNIADDQIKACAATGGVIGINGIGMFADPSGKATPEALCRHIDHIAALVGPQHVGLGLDFVYFAEELYRTFRRHRSVAFPSGYPEPPWDFFPPERMVDLTVCLLERGYDNVAIRGILGENWLRVAGQVWK